MLQGVLHGAGTHCASSWLCRSELHSTEQQRELHRCSALSEPSGGWIYLLPLSLHQVLPESSPKWATRHQMPVCQVPSFRAPALPLDSFAGGPTSQTHSCWRTCAAAGGPHLMSWVWNALHQV